MWVNRRERFVDACGGAGSGVEDCMRFFDKIDDGHGDRGRSHWLLGRPIHLQSLTNYLNTPLPHQLTPYHQQSGITKSSRITGRVRSRRE